MSITKADIAAELRRRGVQIHQDMEMSPISDVSTQNDTLPLPSITKQDIAAELQRRGVSIAPQQEFSLPRYIGEKAAQGAASIADLPLILGEAMEPKVPQWLPERGKEHYKKFEGIPTGVTDTGQVIFEKKRPSKRPSQILIDYLKEKGINLESQKPSTKAQRIAGTAAEFAGSTIGGGGLGLATKAKGLGRLLGAPEAKTAAGKLKELAAMTGIGGIAGGSSQALQEIGTNPIVANLAGMATAPFVPGAAKRLGKAVIPNKLLGIKPEKLPTKQERIMQQYLSKELGGPEALQEAAREIGKYREPGFEYAPTLAQITTNPRIKEIERALSEAPQFPRLKGTIEEGKEQLLNRFEQLAPEVHPEETAQHLEAIQRKAHAHRAKSLEPLKPSTSEMLAGEKVRETIEKEAKHRVKTRQEKAGPLYEALETTETPRTIKAPVEYINTKLKHLPEGSSVKTYLQKAKKLLSKKLTLDDKTKLESYKSLLPIFKGKGPDFTLHDKELGKITKSQLKDKISEIQSPSVAHLENANQELTKNISMAKRKGDYQKARLLGDVQSKLVQDVPELREAAKVYQEHSIPVNKVYEDPLIGKVLKTTKHGHDYQLGPSQVSTDVLKRSMQTHEDAKKIKDILGKDKETIDTVHKYINNDILSNIVDVDTGKVSLGKLEQWKEKHPYASALYPNLETKLSNVKNAQIMVNNIEKVNKKVVDGYYKDSANAALNGRDADLLMAKILRGGNKFKDFEEIMHYVNQDKTGAAKEGLKNSLFNYTKNNIKLDSGELNIRKFDKFLSQNKPILDNLLEPEQVKALREIRDIAQKRHAVVSKRAGAGSRTDILRSEKDNLAKLAGKYSENTLMKYAAKWSHVPFIEKAYSYLRKVGEEARQQRFNEMLDKVLSNPKEAELLLMKPFKDETSMKSFIQKIEEASKIKPYYISPIVQRPEERKRGKE